MKKIIAKRVKKNDIYPEPFKPPISPFHSMEKLEKVLAFFKKPSNTRTEPEILEIAKFLDNAHLLGTMKSQDCIKEITKYAKAELYEQDSIIYKQGKVPDSFYLVLTGEVTFYMFKHNNYHNIRYAPYIDKKDTRDRHQTVSGIMTTVSNNLASLFTGGQMLGGKKVQINIQPAPRSSIDDLGELAIIAKQPMSEEQKIGMAFIIFQNTGKFKSDLKTWNRKCSKPPSLHLCLSLPITIPTKPMSTPRTALKNQPQHSPPL